MIFFHNTNNFWINGHFIIAILHLFHGSIQGNGIDHHRLHHYHQHHHHSQPPKVAAVVTGYSPNVNPFLQLYQNNAQPYVQPYGSNYVQQSGNIQQQQQHNLHQSSHIHTQESSYIHQQQQQTAYIPLQQTYTVAYYPTNQQTPAPAPGPYVPSPPGQRPYCAKNGNTYCEHVEYYPSKLILSLLESIDDVDNFFDKDDSLAIKPPSNYYNITPTYFYDYSYTTNANGQPFYSNNYYPHNRNKRQTDDDMCPVSDDSIRPRAAESSSGEWKFVVNIAGADKKYTQLVKVTKCRTNTCRGLCTPPSGTSAICEQQYVETKLIALDPKGDKIKNEQFKLPHCCICKITSLN